MTAYIKDLSDYDPSSGQQLTTTGNLVAGNYLGVDSTGLTALGNDIGVLMADASSNTLGGTAAGATNVISANQGGAVDSVAIIGSAATGDAVLGNDIGTNSTGTSALPDFGGVFVGDVATYDSNTLTAAAGVASGATIGGTAAGSGNLIASNTGNGIAILGTIATKSTGDSILTNPIGIFVNATAAGNSGSGIAIQYSSGISLFDNTIKNNAGGINITNSTGATIGGTAAGAGNVVSKNTTNGITLNDGIKNISIIGNTIDFEFGYGNLQLIGGLVRTRSLTTRSIAIPRTGSTLSPGVSISPSRATPFRATPAE